MQTEHDQKKVIRWWRLLPDWRTEAARARDVVERLDREVEAGNRRARQIWRDNGSGRSTKTLRTLLQSAAMATTAEQLATGAEIGGGAVRTGWRWLTDSVQEWMHPSALPIWSWSVGAPWMRLVTADATDPAPSQTVDEARRWSLRPLLQYVDEDEPNDEEDPGVRWSATELAWIADRLESEGRLQAWRDGDEVAPRVLLRTPTGFNRGSGNGLACPSWLQVWVMEGRLEAAGRPDWTSLPHAVLKWQPHRRVPLHKGLAATTVATQDLVLAMKPLGAGSGRAEAAAACEAALRREWHAFKVRVALRKGPATIAERAMGRAATVEELLYLSTGYGGGQRRRILFARYRALGREALNPSQQGYRTIADAVDRGAPLGRIISLACGAPPPTDLAADLEQDAARYFAEGKWPVDIEPRFKRWRIARPCRNDAEEAALDSLLSELRPNSPVGLLLLTQPRRFASWIAQDPLRLRTLARSLHASLPLLPPEDVLHRFVRTELAATAWRAAARRRPQGSPRPLEGLADVVGMLASDLLVPRARAEDSMARALSLRNRLPEPVSANRAASLILWGITFDSEAGGTRWSALQRTCEQIHRPDVLVARDRILDVANRQGTFTPPAGWTALTPAERSGVRHLATDEALRHEGERMRHCVGSYDSRVLAGKCDLFHIEGRPWGLTLEVRERWSGDRVSYHPDQIRGRNNRQP
ncbi:MAG: PcfJ domain-containing protein, partial [Rhodospirillaceae bacterium]|nr:PcfJ domain-containing protein [Rhodospirillaceae bacterium]